MRVLAKNVDFFIENFLLARSPRSKTFKDLIFLEVKKRYLQNFAIHVFSRVSAKKFELAHPWI